MKYFFIIIVFLLVSCSPTPPEKKDIEAWFNKNYQLLNELKEIGGEHPSLRRAEPSLKEYTDYYHDPTKDALEAEARVYEIIDELEIDFVSFGRSYPEFEELSFLSVPAYRWGLSLGGYSIMIVYIEDQSSIRRILDNGHKTIFTQLEKDGWYIEESDTR